MSARSNHATLARLRLDALHLTLTMEYHLKALPIRRAHPDDMLAWTLQDLGQGLVAVRRPQAAEPYCREALALYRKLHPQEDVKGTAWMSLTFGDALYQQHKLPEAKQAYREALGIYAKCQAVGSGDYAQAARSLVKTLKAENKPAEVEALYREVLAALRSALGNDSPTVPVALCEFADFLKSQNRPEAAAQQYREAVGIGLNPRTEDLVKLPPVVEKLAGELRARGETQDAEKLYDDAIQVVRRKLGESHPALGTLLYNLSDLLRGEHKLDAAAEQCLHALQIRRATKDDALAATLRRLGWLQLRIGKPGDAERSLRESLEVYRALHQQEDYLGTALPTLILAEALFQQHRLPEAERSCREAVAAFSRFRANDREDNYLHAVYWVIRVLRTENKLAEAESFLNEVLSNERPIAVAASLIGDASLLKNANQPGDAETADYFFRCASEILQKLRGEDFLGLPWWAILRLVDGGYKQQATNICWRMLDSPTTNTAWFNNVSWYLATAENPMSRDPALAVELAKRVAELSPENGNAWNTLGAARYSAGDFKQALADLGNSMEQADFADQSSFNCFFVAMAHHQLGNDDAARRYYAQAIKWMNEHGPKNPELLRFRAEAELLLGPAVQPQVENGR